MICGLSRYNRCAILPYHHGFGTNTIFCYRSPSSKSHSYQDPPELSTVVLCHHLNVLQRRRLRRHATAAGRWNAAATLIYEQMPYLGIVMVSHPGFNIEIPNLIHNFEPSDAENGLSLGRAALSKCSAVE